MLKKTGYLVMCALLVSACGGGSNTGGGPRESVLFGAREMPEGDKVLWRTDGTAAGTGRVRADQIAMPAAPRFPHMVSMNGLHYFAATRSFGTSLLWVSDGTEAGTQPLESALYPGPVSPGSFTRLDDVIYFNASGGVGVQDLWRTDGTPEGTYRLDNLLPLSDVAPHPSSMVVLGGQLFMVVYTGLNQRGVIRLSAGEETATLLREVDRQGFTQMVAFRERLLVAESVGGVSHLWSIAPDTGDAVSLLELPMNGTFRAISSLRVMGDHVYFLGTDADYGEELWVSDGTVSGTRLHTDMTPGIAGTQFYQLYSADNVLLIVAAADAGAGVWAVENVGAPARVILDLPLAELISNILGTYQDSLYFHRPRDAGGQLCAVTVSAPGLRCLEAPVTPVPTYSVLPLNNDLLFVGRSEGTGVELWRTRPALSGAELIMDICPGDCAAF
ncbi:hypothetical protein [Alcanivorax sp. S71-1-4]|uniref:hypothetical protein n=1 Tax=Alcanivorax sp. S71-1-4 TaxID=1177159 RepID=UPI0013592FD0|nr:hypothetical protein [Alcanivorax sp. S71-1-4]